MKVYDTNNEMKQIEAKKTWTFKDLAQEITKHKDSLSWGKDFPEEFRLRAYDPKLGVCLKPYEIDETTLIDAGIHSFFLFKIEPFPFTPFNPDETHVRVISWNNVEGATGGEEADDFPCFDLKELDLLQYELLKINRKEMTLTDLEHQISLATGISQDRLLILLRHEGMTLTAQPRVELLNMDWARSKKLSELRTSFDHGMMIFVEEGEMKGLKFEQLNWYKAIIGNEDMLKLHVTIDQGAGSLQEKFMDIKINKKRTLSDLKEKIG